MKMVNVKATVRSFFLIILSSAVFTGAVYAELSITRPGEGDDVKGHIQLVQGKNDPSGQFVYVVVHPLLVSGDIPKWWVQPIPTPRKDGKWQTTVYLGQEDLARPEGEYFEIVALASNKRDALREGLVLREIPEGFTISDVITVKRVN